MLTLLEALPHKRIALAGDWHGNGAWARAAFQYAAERGAQGMIQLGDFGLWPGEPGRAYLRQVNMAAREHEMWFAFVDGNHDDHWQLASLPITPDGVRRVAGEIVHLPRGYRWQWGQQRWMALGGAVSLDRKHRKIGKSWWPTETITHAEARQAMDGGPVDVMLTHDVPSIVDVPGLEPEDRWEPLAMRDSKAHRRLLDQVAEAVRPRWWFHGHMHVDYQREVIIGRRACRFRGLDCEGGSFDSNVVLVNGATLQPVDGSRA